jgi:hypothetical protein
MHFGSPRFRKQVYGCDNRMVQPHTNLELPVSFHRLVRCQQPLQYNGLYERKRAKAEPIAHLGA